MKPRLLEHLLSILFVLGVFLLLAETTGKPRPPLRSGPEAAAESYLQLDSVDFGSPVDVQLFQETLHLFHPGSPGAVDSIVEAIRNLRVERFTNAAYKSGGEDPGLTGARLAKLSTMYLQFLLVYLIVMVLSYLASRSLAVYRFVKWKQGRGSYLHEFVRLWQGRHPVRVVKAVALLTKATARGAAYVVLFSPAYVIAYSVKTRLDTDTVLFMVILGVVSNGLLINYANKFFTFLVDESRKGYVDTAVVKNLSDSYAWQRPDGIPYRALLRPGSVLSSHVFRHIYLNARYQYRPTLKEHASFLITGLIIIEMALNIQGHLGYEMLQEILYKRYDVVVAIIFGIFLLVKGTEIAVDLWTSHESSRYENR